MYHYARVTTTIFAMSCDSLEIHNSKKIADTIRIVSEIFSNCNFHLSISEINIQKMLNFRLLRFREYLAASNKDTNISDF